MTGRSENRRSLKMPKGGFLDLPVELQDPGRAKVVVLPIPFEETVSYGTGTRNGPSAIIHASQQVELYDPDFDSEPALRYGVHTLPALSMEGQGGQRIARAAESAVHSGKLLVALGGEHGISPAIVRGVLSAVNEPLTVVQIDAHADLRDTYQGNRDSHACAMRRILEENSGPAVQLGIRSYSLEEADFMRDNRGRVNVWTMDRIRESDPLDFQRTVSSEVKGKKVYLTIDVDGFDPSVVPATGTPEPDGLSWHQVIDILTTVAEAGDVVAMDCVELAPIPGLHSSEYAVARMLYKAVSFIQAGRSG